MITESGCLWLQGVIPIQIQSFLFAQGINVYAACFLIPLGVVIYTAIGGLRATFLSCYIHSIIIFVVINLIAIKAGYAPVNATSCPCCILDHYYIEFHIFHKQPVLVIDEATYSFADLLILLWPWQHRQHVGKVKLSSFLGPPDSRSMINFSLASALSTPSAFT